MDKETQSCVSKDDWSQEEKTFILIEASLDPRTTKLLFIFKSSERDFKDNSEQNIIILIIKNIFSLKSYIFIFLLYPKVVIESLEYLYC